MKNHPIVLTKEAKPKGANVYVDQAGNYHMTNQQGGFIPLAAIPPILSSVAALKTIKPISKLDDAFKLSDKPIIGAPVKALKWLGLGEGVEGPRINPAGLVRVASGVYLPAIHEPFSLSVGQLTTKA